MKQRYDLAFGLGMTCGCSLTLRKARLQYLSFPGDWTAPVWFNAENPRLRHGLCLRANILCRGLGDFLRLEDLRFDRTHPWNGKDVYFNERTRYVFNHDFPAGGNLAQELPKVQLKYQRRYKRLTDLIRASKRVLAVRIDTPSDRNWPPTSLDDCRQARKALSEAFPQTTFDFVLLNFEKGRPYGQRTDERTDDGIYHYAFDYSNPKPGADPLLPDLSVTARLLADRFSVRDYRTREEITTHKTERRHKAWAKVGANSSIDFILKKAVHRIKRAIA